MELNESLRNLLADDATVRERAAEGLYDSPERSTLLSSAEAAPALLASVERGNRSAAALLLLSYAPGSAPLLKKLAAEHASDLVKLRSWSRPVPLSVAATVALSRIGDADARRTLLERAAEYPDAVRVFLLDVLTDVDSPEVWHQFAAYLHDETEIPEGVPSGAARRRVADRAVDAFLDRLNLPVSFARNSGGRYTTDQIDETLRVLRERVPR
ncbi:MAG: hypothetical protein HY820_17700 [Acidobacteria bacterium]|nr:hypothetical protein [Acidobacteriota bacterium]